MIVHDSWWSNGSVRSTIINYHEPFDQGLRKTRLIITYQSTLQIYNKFVFGNQGLKCETQKCKFFQDISSRENIHYPHDHQQIQASASTSI